MIYDKSSVIKILMYQAKTEEEAAFMIPKTLQKLNIHELNRLLTMLKIVKGEDLDN